ncbi:MAG: hypothetical protein M1133_12735 [Armatimonadetes bacterium]|nr:hypothetical protein [Armatimonadota bacterium]
MNPECFNYCPSAEKRCPAATLDGTCGVPDVSSCLVYRTTHTAEPRLEQPIWDYFGCPVLRDTAAAIERRFQENGLCVPAESIRSSISVIAIPAFVFSHHPGNVTLLWRYRDPGTGISWVLSPQVLHIQAGVCLECGRTFDFKRVTRMFCSEACQKRFTRRKQRQTGARRRQ